MEFRVSEVCQSASGGSFVAKYKADVEVGPGTGAAVIEIANTIPGAADPELLRRTIESIRRGAESVLKTHGLNANLRLRDLFIHDVDCKPGRFEKPTAEALARVLAANA